MKCPKCNSDKLSIFSKFRYLEHSNGEWFNVTPFEEHLPNVKSFFKCNHCELVLDFNTVNNSIIFKENEIKFSNFKIKNRILPKRLVLDLDHTLIASFQTNDDDLSGEFSFNIDNLHYEVAIRPRLKEFLDFCNVHFEEIEVITASVESYAKNICKNIGLNNVKLTTRESLKEDYTVMTNDLDFIKEVNDSVVIDDKPQVIKGTGNVILNPKAFWYDSGDTELTKILDYLTKN
jgi:2-hydroxy-3-keto-5-methylthiopentenyl-1-phosphate phosphatase